MVDCRPAAEQDREFVTALRNDPEIISLGLSNSQASSTWFDEVKNSVYVILEDGQPVGYAIKAPVQEISIALARSARGRGVGTEAIRILAGPSRHVLARIQTTNTASLRAFEKAGFHEPIGIRSLYKSPR